jgi:hypothetical protein
LADLLDGIAFVEKRRDMVRDEARRRLAADAGALDGRYTLAPGKVRRKVEDAYACLDAFPSIIMREAVTISIPDLEKAAKKHLGVTGPKAKAYVADVLKERIVEERGADELRRVSK